MKCDELYRYGCKNFAKHRIDVIIPGPIPRLLVRHILCDKHAYKLLEKSKKPHRKNKIVASCPYATNRRIRKR